MSKTKTLSTNKSNLIIHKKPEVKKGFYELFYLPNVKILKELHQQLQRLPTIADIRNALNCEVSQAEKIYKLYSGDEKHNKEIKVELPDFLLKALNHAINIITADRSNDIELANKEIAGQNEVMSNENKILQQQNKNLQGDLLELQQKVNDAKIQLKETDKLVEFLKTELSNLQKKYDDVINNMLFKTAKQKTPKVKSEKVEITLADLFSK